MAGPYPLELRQRVMDAYDDGEGSIVEICERFRVSRNLIRDWDKLRKETGSLMPHRMGGARDHSAERVVDGAGDEFLRDLLRELPDTTALEAVAAYREQFDVEVHPEAMRRTFHRLGFRFKRGLSDRREPSGPMWSKNERPSEPT